MHRSRVCSLLQLNCHQRGNRFVPELGDYLLEPSDVITCVLSCGLYYDGGMANYWILGSEVIHERRTSGRLSVCALQQGGIICLVASATLYGAVEAVAGIDGKIAVAAGAGVSTSHVNPFIYFSPDFNLHDL